MANLSRQIVFSDFLSHALLAMLHMRAQDSFEEVEEERRVLYVAMTRAKDALIITRQNLNTWATSRIDGQNRTIESYFLSEVPTNLLPNDSGFNSFGGFRAENSFHQPLKKKPKIGIDFDDDDDLDGWGGSDYEGTLF